tara:strand:+ start:108 stop:848 length:741 start_codon:yes stop_codon:yes gene_type:complete
MLLLDLLDAIIKFIIGLIPITIALISLFIAYYFYIKNKLYDETLNNQRLEKKESNDEKFENFFENKGCYENNNKECKFDLTKHFSFKCPKQFCSDKKENFVNQNFLIPNNLKLSKIITNKTTKENPNYICFDGNNCITKQKDFTKPWDNNCGSPYISDYQNKIYTSEDECYKENIEYKYLNKKDCLEMPHGYGWLDTEGCVKGTPEGPNNRNSSFFLYGKNKKRYTPSNPNPYVLPLYNPYYSNIL